METQLLLLHGAGLGRWIWEPVIPHLEAATTAIDFPGTRTGHNPKQLSLNDYVQKAASEIRPGTILVGHSIGAEVAMALAAQHPDLVSGLVLIGGMVPENGKSFLSLLPLPQRILLNCLLRVYRNGLPLPPSMVEEEYCNDLDEAATKSVVERTTVESPGLYLDRLNWSGIPRDLPRFYIKLTEDKSVDPAHQDKIAQRIGAHEVIDLSAGHLPMMGKPIELAAVLNKISNAVKSTATPFVNIS